MLEFSVVVINNVSSVESFVMFTGPVIFVAPVPCGVILISALDDVVDIVHGGGGGSPRKFMPRDTVIDRKQFKLASKHAAEKYQAKTKAMMKKKEKEDLEKWFANTGDGGGGQRNDHHDNPDHHHHRRHNRGNTTM